MKMEVRQCRGDWGSMGGEGNGYVASDVERGQQCSRAGQDNE